MTTPDEQQQPARIPGVKYRPVERTRLETTTINGISETREVAYTVLEPVPPRDWDALVIRGVVGFTAVAVVLAAAATTASVGALLDKTVPQLVAYSAGVLFTGTWLLCLGVEWLERRDPKRAMPAKVAGWITLLIAMAAVIAYCEDMGEPLAGFVGACLDLLAKGSCALVIRYHSTQLSEPVAFWLRRRRERLAAETAVAEEIQRLDRYAAYNRAVYGPTAATAAAVTTAAVEAPRPLPAPAEPAPAVVTVEVTPAPAPVPAPPVQAPAAPVQAPAAPAPAPAPVVPPQPVPAPAPVVLTKPAPAPAPVEPAPVPAAPAPAPAPPAAEPEDEADSADDEPPAAAGTGPALRTVGAPSIAGTIRAALVAKPRISDEDLIAHVAQVHGPSDKYEETVPRTRRRIENPKPKPRKRKAS